MKQRRALLCAILGGLLLYPSAAVSGTLSDSGNNTLKARKKFLQIGYNYNTFNRKDGAELKNDIGLSLTWGKSYYLHKPINGRWRIGLDWAWTDITYTNYKVSYVYADDNATQSYDDENNYADTHPYTRTDMHGVDIGMQVGPSVTCSIDKHLQVHAYVRYAPALSVFYDGENFQGGFGNFFVVGANVSWRFIGLGIEGRFGSATYKNLDEDDEENYYDDFVKDGVHIAPHAKGKTSYSGFRAYITFRF